MRSPEIEPDLPGLAFRGTYLSTIQRYKEKPDVKIGKAQKSATVALLASVWAAALAMCLLAEWEWVPKSFFVNVKHLVQAAVLYC
jgi:hypothetical protein